MSNRLTLSTALELRDLYRIVWSDGRESEPGTWDQVTGDACDFGSNRHVNDDHEIVEVEGAHDGDTSRVVGEIVEVQSCA
jgi:hypothetical protein